MHLALHAFTVRTAIEKNIKLILWGENSATEYGGTEKLKGMYMTMNGENIMVFTTEKEINFWFDKKLKKYNTAPYNLQVKNKLINMGLKKFF